jgi:hypothetical protein
MWRYMVPFFEKDYRIVLFDYVGSGSSQINYYNSDKYNRLEGYAEVVLDIMDTPIRCATSLRHLQTPISGRIHAKRTTLTMCGIVKVVNKSR